MGPGLRGSPAAGLDAAAVEGEPHSIKASKHHGSFLVCRMRMADKNGAPGNVHPFPGAPFLWL